MTRLARMRELAKVATPGPWNHIPADNVIVSGTGTGGRMIDVCTRSQDVSTEQRDANAAYISALSPEVVLAMLDVIEAADAMAWEPCHIPEQAAEVCQRYADARAKLEQEP